MKVTFNINFHTVWGQKLCVVGSIPELGSWEPALAKEMNYSGDGNWKLELDLPPDIKDIEYRYFLSVMISRSLRSGRRITGLYWMDNLILTSFMIIGKSVRII